MAEEHMQRRSLMSNQSPPQQHSMDRINTDLFYDEYHGHKIPHLRSVLHALKTTTSTKDKSIIYTAGDSSLDNKYWFNNTTDAVGAYRNVLDPPIMKPDVTYWINKLAIERELPFTAINTAVEATTLNQRACCSLLKQDKFIKRNIRENDVLVVSIGGNDIALMPAPCTICNMILLQCCTPISCIKKTKPCCSIPCDDCCCSCGFGCLAACTTSFPACCMGYFYHLFRTRIEVYIKNLTSGSYRPKKIIIAMIYYPDEMETGSWADGTLGILGYNSNPSKLQLLIKKVFEDAVSKIKIPGSEVIPLPLFRYLDGKNTNDYCQRVEPSPSGGKKMANQILDLLS
jgi:hypothetical protein